MIPISGTVPAGMRVLAVCLGNICRSPTAEAAIREAAGEAGLSLEVDSAATGAWHLGDRPDPRMRAAGQANNLLIDGTARQIRIGDFDDFDLILAMDRQNLSDLLTLAPSPKAAEKVRLFRTFDPEAASDEVPDPYYGGERGFQEVIDMSRAAARGLVDAVRSRT